MVESINFYCARVETFYRTVYKLLDKCYTILLNTVVLVPDCELEESLNKNLWSFNSTSFIPHGCSSDPSPDDQPIYITTSCENPNQAKILVMLNCNDINYDYLCKFRKILIVFDDNNVDRLNYMQEIYLKLKQQGYSLSYFKQDNKMQWELL